MKSSKRPASNAAKPPVLLTEGPDPLPCGCVFGRFHCREADRLWALVLAAEVESEEWQRLSHEYNAHINGEVNDDKER